MRPFENHELDPDIAAELSALDGALSGQPVAPEHAELAELAVLVSAEHPQIDPAFASQLDQRVARRFALDVAPAAKPRRKRVWLLSGAATAVAGVLAAVVVAVGSSSGPMQQSISTAVPSTSSGSSGNSAAAGSGAAAAGSGSTPSTSVPPPLTQAPGGARKVVQSAQLALATTPARIENVAGQVFEVVRVEGGYVGQSTVTSTGGSDGYAQFQLSVPSASLSDAMGRLSRLHDAQVASRTDTTQDVNDQYGSLTRQLSDARALRTALLKQLAAASDPQKIASLKGQISDADTAIGRAQSSLNSLNRQINYTQISLSVSADQNATAGGGFTIGRGAHVAGRVLTVAAGVALIALAVLFPLALVALLFWWVGATLRRRRREQALDVA